MKICEIQKLLKEYNKSGKNMTTLAAPGGEKASGKNYDNIAVGKTQDYKIRDEETEYMKMFPILAPIIKSVKNDEMGTKKVLSGPAIKAMFDLHKISPFKKDSDDETGKTWILPFGDGIRLEKDDNRNVFCVYSKKKEEKSISDIEDKNLTDILI